MHAPSLPAFVRTMEAALVAALAEEGIVARGRDDEGHEYTGVWVEDRKIASIGVHRSRGVSAHGFAINVDNDVEPFHQVTACGLPGVRMTSIALETGRDAACRASASAPATPSRRRTGCDNGSSPRRAWVCVPRTPSSPSQRLAERFREQAGTAVQRGSPLYVALLRAAADDIVAGGPVWELLEEHAGDPPGSVVQLRLMAAVHRLVLTGAAPELAAFYPSAGGTSCGSGLARVRRVVRERADVLRPLIARPLQTNEVGRCAALLPGFAAVARATGSPLRVLELGASAGLNLNWDRYRYDARGRGVRPGRLPRPTPARRSPAARTACRRATRLRRRAARSRHTPMTG